MGGLYFLLPLAAFFSAFFFFCFCRSFLDIAIGAGIGLFVLNRKYHTRIPNPRRSIKQRSTVFFEIVFQYHFFIEQVHLSHR